jgi:hypothetical protein
MTSRKTISSAAVGLIGLVLAACGGGASGSSVTAAPAGGAATEAISSSQMPAASRSVVLSHVTGAVQMSENAAGNPTPAAADQPIVPGSSIQTGQGGSATLELEDGTRVKLEENTSMDVVQLAGTPEVPVSKFRLNGGQAYAFHQGAFPEGASFDIETPAGTASIQHSMMSVSFDKDTGKIRLTCLEGDCSLNRGEQSLNLTGGQAVDITGLAGAFDQSFVRNMTQAEVQGWIDANLACECGYDIRFIFDHATQEATSEAGAGTAPAPGGGTSGPSGGYCGDGVCGANESFASCQQDCLYPNPYCGDAICNGSENSVSCPADCSSASGFCGDANCNNGETQFTCPGDCGAPPYCGDSICNGTEDHTTCPGDCP